MGLGDLGQALLALMFVLGLIGLLAMAARRFGIGGINTMAQHGNKKRLGVVEVKSLDARRRLVLIRRDDVEHLIIVGPDGETVVESGIPTPKTDAPEVGLSPDHSAAVQPMNPPRLAATRESET